MDTVHEPFHAEPFANGTHSEETDTFFIESGIDHHKIKTGFNEKVPNSKQSVPITTKTPRFAKQLGPVSFKKVASRRNRHPKLPTDLDFSELTAITPGIDYLTTPTVDTF